MKVFKKITAFAVAMTMGCSVFAFTACNNDDNDGKDEGANILPSGMPAQTVDTGLALALKEKNDYLTVNYTNKTSGAETYSTRVGKVDTSTETTTYEINLAASGTVDLNNGDADLVAKSTSTYESTNKDKDFSYELSSTNYTEYDFLRSWNMFSYTTHEDEEVTDFTGLELSYDGSANVDWEEVLGQFGSIGGGSDVSLYAETPDLSILPTTGDLAKLSMANENELLVRLAAAANTLKYKNGAYCIDLIETVDTVINEVGSVVYALKGVNTVGDILNNAIIKKYFSVITDLVPVELAKATVEDIKPLLLFIQQDLNALKTVEASTTYDYIVSLISSQNLVNIANTIITFMQSQGAAPTAESLSEATATNAFFTKTLDKYSVNEILTLVNSMAQLPLPITLEVLQSAYQLYVEPVCDGEKIILGPNSAITELSVEYKVGNGKLVSQKMSYAFENESSYASSGSGSDGVATSYYYAKKETQEGTIEITYETSAAALKDISANPVSQYVYEWDEDYLDWFYVGGESSEEGEPQKFYVCADVVDGEYAGFKLYDENMQLIGTDANSIEFQVGNAQYVIRESGRTISDQEIVDYCVVENNTDEECATACLTQQLVKQTITVAEFLEANAQ